MADKVLMLVSKEHISNVKKLYKIIFQLHKSLPPPMKQIGDAYVRHEFKLHKNAASEHVGKFMSEWTNYALTLGKQLNPKLNKKIRIETDEKKLEEFNDDQIQQLFELFKEITSIQNKSK